MQKRKIDSFFIDLKVNCKIDNGHIKAIASIDLLINDKGKVLELGNVLETDQLRAALQVDGNYMIYNCSCSNPGCAGLEKGITIKTVDKLLHWQDLDANEEFTFEKLTVLIQLNQLEKDLRFYKKKFTEFEIELVIEN